MGVKAAPPNMPAAPLGLGGAARPRGRHRRGPTSRTALKDDIPLLNAVQERGDRSSDVPFHVPGHKRGASTPPALQRLLGSSLKYDLTELEGLDFLATPTGVIQEAQRLAAETWGADATWFLVNGTTVGIHAAVMATCGPGDTLIVTRNAHLSAFNAMVLAGCDALYVQPKYDPSFEVAHQVTVASLRAAFQRAAEEGRRVGAVLVVSPTYFGVLSDIQGLAAVCHLHGVPLLVDEAHGAHLGLAPGLPRSALQQGADVAVQSTHKQLSALTQAAMLHAKGGLVSHTKLARALQVLQSSSPSYLLMSSLDAARAQASDSAAFAECLAAAAFARQRLSQLPGVQLLSHAHLDRQQAALRSSGGASNSEERGGGGGETAPATEHTVGGAGRLSEQEEHQLSQGFDLDPLRLTLTFRELGLSGHEAAERLECEHHIVPELAGPSCAVLAMSIGSTMQHAEALVAAVERLCSGAAAAGIEAGQPTERAGALREAAGLPAGGSAPLEAAPALLQPAVSPRAAYHAGSTRVPLAQAAGRISAELLCPYPPGVPAVLPGEIITDGILSALASVRASGGRVAGCTDPSLQTIAVLLQ